MGWCIKGYQLIPMTKNYVPFNYIVKKLKREKTILLSAVLVSWALSWNIVGSLYNPKDAASSLCTMTSAKKGSSNSNYNYPIHQVNTEQITLLLTCISPYRRGEMSIERCCKPIMMEFWGTKIPTTEVNCLNFENQEKK